MFAACDKNDNRVEENAHVKPVFVTNLNPVDDEGLSNDVSENVIQGIASFENGWFVTQKSGTSILLINYLDQNGTSLFHQRLSLNSHGQDLSLEIISNNELYLYTTTGTFSENRNTGMIKLYVELPEMNDNTRDWQLTNISFEEEYLLNYSNATPTINESKTQFAIRSKNTILIHDKELIDNFDFTQTHHFELNNSQLTDNYNYSMWFQGIAMKNNRVYCLTGNEKINTEKKIFVYDLNGIVTNKFIFDQSDFNQSFFEKFEPEGLSFINNEMYFTIMTKSETTSGNIKYLFKL
jgi:hypothetical protein